MNHLKGEALNVGFDRGINLEFHGAKVTSDGGPPENADGIHDFSNAGSPTTTTCM